jgi:hypothetical protein
MYRPVGYWLARKTPIEESGRELGIAFMNLQDSSQTESCENAGLIKSVSHIHPHDAEQTVDVGSDFMMGPIHIPSPGG